MNAKNFSLIAVAALIVCGNVNAQTTSYYNTRHEIGVTVGAGSISEIASGISDFTEVLVSATMSTIITGGTETVYYTYGDESYIPTISAEYYYHVNKIIGLGGFVAFSGMERDMYYTWKTSGVEHKQYSGKAKHRNFSIIPTAKFDWLRMKHFGLYSKAGVGIMIINESQKDDKKEGADYNSTEIAPNIQLTLLGVEAGTENWRGFVEGGVGEQGMLVAGLRYKF